MMDRRGFLGSSILAFIGGLFSGRALASQTLTVPKTWALTIGASSAQVLPANAGRSSLWIHNPSAVGGNTVSLCGAADGGPAGNGVATVNGAGTITLPPGAFITVDATKWTDAINAIASGGGTPLTIIEFT